MRFLLPLLCCAALAVPASAQRSGAQRFAAPLVSDTQGLYLQAHLNGQSMNAEDDDSGAEFDGQGGGGGLRIGYGFSPLFTLFLEADGSAMDGELDGDFGNTVEGEFGYGSITLGGQFNFGAGTNRLVPFAEVGLSGHAATFEDENDDDNSLSFTGGAITLGGGVQYFVTPKLAVRGGISLVGGRFTDVQVDGDNTTTTFRDEIDFGVGAGRLTFGVGFYL